MPEIRQQAEIYLVNYFCDKCKNGHLLFTGKRREAAIKRGVYYYIHKCSSCGDIREFENKQYPYQQFEVKLADHVKKNTKKTKSR